MMSQLFRINNLKSVLLLVFLFFCASTFSQKQPVAGNCQDMKNSLNKIQQAVSTTSSLISDTIHVIHYGIHIDTINFTAKTIRAFTDVQLVSKQNGVNSISLNLLHLTIDSIISTGQSLTYSYNDTLITMTSPSVLNINDTLNLTVYYHGVPQTDASGWGGFYINNLYAYNLGVGFAAVPHNLGKVWFPCVDEFTDRAKYDFYINTPSNKKAACNGILMSQTTNPNGTIAWHWQLNNPIPTYLACMAVGPYYFLTRYPQGIETMWACTTGDTNNVLATFQHIDTCLAFYQNAWGPYPWNRVGYSLVPFNSGAMEHATNISIGSGFINGTLTYETLWAHELSHMYWGDHVTCETSGDMWLNEGWATYNEAFFTQQVYGNTAYKDWLRTNHRKVLQFAHITDGSYLSLINVPDNYTYGQTVYNKGADVVHTLRNYMGDSAFFTGAKYYQNNRAFGNANSYNLRDDLTNGTGINMTRFFDDWVFTEGFPHFSIDSVVYMPGGLDHYFVYTRQRTKGNNNHLYEMPVQVTFSNGVMSDTTVTILIDSVTNVFHIPLLGLFDFVALDRNEKISDAISDYERTITTTGSFTFPETNATLNVQNAGSTSNVVRMEHNFVAPDGFKGSNPGIRLSDYHYWKADGLFAPGFTSTVTFNYNGSLSVTTGYLDNTLITGIEDSVVLLYRQGTWDDWHVVQDDTLLKGPSSVDKVGTIRVDTLLKGEYTLGYYDYTLTGFSSNTIKQDPVIKVIPNPAKHECSIELNLKGKNGQLLICDAKGSLVKKVNVFSHQTIVVLDINQLREGIYLINLVVNDEIKDTEKLVVKK